MADHERRVFHRLPFYAEVKVEGTSEVYFHPASNLSMGGVFLNTEFPLSIGTQVFMEIENPIGGGILRLEGEVAWRQDGAKEGTPEALAQPPIQVGMGIAFKRMTPSMRDQLRAAIARLTRENMKSKD